jgi:hypothetical protein
MHRRPYTWLAGAVVAAAVAVLASTSLLAQDGKAAGGASRAPAKKFMTPRTPWGDPDLAGVWDYRTITPLERPQNMAGRAQLTDEEVANLERQAAKNLDEPPDENTPANLVHAPYMTDRGRKVLDDRRTSLIIEPSDGRVPPLTPEAQKRNAMRRGGGRDGGADGPESRSTAERCITYGFPNATLPTLYNNNIRILQGPGYVAITHEMIHETRVIPLDGRAALGSTIHQWFGDSRGHWEGDTLVVESQNFSDKTNYRGSGATLHTIERFTRVAKDRIDFQVTIDDPHTFVRPWTIELPMRPADGPIYEYACHEANVGLYDILEVARDTEKAQSKSK